VQIVVTTTLVPSAPGIFSYRAPQFGQANGSGSGVASGSAIPWPIARSGTPRLLPDPAAPARHQTKESRPWDTVKLPDEGRRGFLTASAAAGAISLLDGYCRRRLATKLRRLYRVGDSP
jgi:hypothetical protein